MYIRYLYFSHVLVLEPRLVGSMVRIDYPLSISIPDRVASGRWYAGLFCVMLSHHLCGFYISNVALGAQLGIPVLCHLRMTSRATPRNAGRHSWPERVAAASGPVVSAAKTSSSFSKSV